MKVLLINPRFSNTTTDVPLGLAYIAAVAKNAECDVKVVDADAAKSNITNDDILATAKNYKPDIIGISIYTSFARRAYKLLNILSSLQIPVVVGGPHPTAIPEEPFNFGSSFVVRGEGEETFYELIEHLRGKRLIDSIRGLSYLAGHKIIHNEPRALIEDIDNISLPAKELFNRENYVGRMWAHPFGGVLTSRGCPGKCIYCSNEVMGRRYRFRQPSMVIEEIKFLKDKYGIKRFTFVDDTFTANKERIVATCHLILKEKLDIQWSCYSRVNFVDPNLLSLMKEAGCILIDYGIEHGDDNSLKMLRKGITLDIVKKALSWTKEAGIRYSTNYILGFPWETIQSINRTLQHALEFHDCGFQSGPIVPYPGTEFYETYKHEYGLEDWWLKRDGIRGQDIKLIAEGHKFAEFAFFRLDPQKEKMIERTFSKFYSAHLRYKNDSRKLFSIRGWIYWLLYFSYKISPDLERKINNIRSKVARLKRFFAGYKEKE